MKGLKACLPFACLCAPQPLTWASDTPYVPTGEAIPFPLHKAFLEEIPALISKVPEFCYKVPIFI